MQNCWLYNASSTKRMFFHFSHKRRVSDRSKDARQISHNAPSTSIRLFVAELSSTKFKEIYNGSSFVQWSRKSFHRVL